MENGCFHNGSQSAANILNRYFIRKPIDIVNYLPVNNVDPMMYYKNNVKKVNCLRFKPINMSDLRRAMTLLNKSNSLTIMELV